MSTTCDLPELPTGWAWATVEQLAAAEDRSITDGPFGSNLKTEHYTNDGARVIRLQNIACCEFIDEKAYISQDHFQRLQKHQVRGGDIVIRSLGSPSPTACMIPDSIGDAIVKADCFRYKVAEPFVNPKYVMYALNCPSTQKRTETLVHGVGRPRLNLSEVKSIPLPLSPLPEQHRIVSKIEELFTKLDAGVEELRKAKARLRRYQRSVLEAGVTGKLTQSWRIAHGKNIEPAELLLSRILQDRREECKTHQSIQWNTNGKRNRNIGSQYEEPNAPVTELNVAEEWCMARTDQVFSYVTSGSRNWAKFYTDSGALFVRVGNLNQYDIGLDFGFVQFVQPNIGSEGARTRLIANDILISITADVGMVGLVPPAIGEAYINQHVALARPVKSINPKFLAWLLSSDIGQRQLRNLQRGATKAGLGLDDIRAVDFGLPPIEEQSEIVNEIERHLSVIQNMNVALESCSTESNRLRQSILSEAFSGKLVPQDPNDEPAERLLERIRQSTSTIIPNRRRRKSSGDSTNGK